MQSEPNPIDTDKTDEKLAHYLGLEQAAERLKSVADELGASEFAQVRNIDYVFSPWELYPLAPRVQPPLERIAAFAVDMDGTSTTTEPLALHCLEYMVRRFTGRLDRRQWTGLDEKLDYPHIIGNSNFRHTEFLMQRYRQQLDREAFCHAFLEALCWTLANMTDDRRRRDVIQTARNCGLSNLLEDGQFRKLVDSGTVTPDSVGRQVEPFVQRFGRAFDCDNYTAMVSAALDIYYARYHAILQLIEQGKGEKLSRQLLGQAHERLIEPMPGYELFITLVKGWLGEKAEALYEMLRSHLLAHGQHGKDELDGCRGRLARLGRHFLRQPAKLALVTASIAYETHIVIKEVVRVMAENVQHWPLPAELRQRLAEHFADHRNIYDGLVCATDSSEARLKPHRDLYSIALYQMSIPKTQYSQCVGLEDTEPGIIALRAAGIGCAVALPNRDTGRQDYSMAVKVVRGGLPELILVENLLLKQY